jgi:hypothetical protein
MTLNRGPDAVHDILLWEGGVGTVKILVQTKQVRQLGFLYLSYHHFLCRTL